VIKGSIPNTSPFGEGGPSFERAFPGWYVQHNKQITGSRLAMMRAFQVAHENHADHLIYCEDDLNVAAGAINRVIADIPDIGDLGFLTYYDGRRLNEGVEHGIHRRNCKESDSPVDYFAGSLCMLFPKPVIEYLVTCDPLHAPIFDGWGYYGSDAVIGYFLDKSGRWPQYGIRVPTLVDHVGDVSSIIPSNRPIRGKNFAGSRDPIFEAMNRDRSE
jgi:hypothetical protein